MNDLDVVEMFREKNKAIFQKSLMLEMERNLETLMQTIDNIATLELNKTCNFLKQYLDEINIGHSEKILEKKFLEKKKELSKIINEKIDEKKKELDKYFEKETKSASNLTKKYIEEYHKYMDETTGKTVKRIENDLKEYISTDFTPSIIKSYAFKEEQKYRIKGRINNIFTETMVKRVIEEIKFRDESLKNICNESYEKYLKLNEITS